MATTVRKIVVLQDGTGNAAASIWRTNVWRMFEAIDHSKHDQVVFYDDGIGTSSFKLFALLAGAFGFGLKRNVIECYKFISRNYSEGAEIYGFGFSRGAYAIRLVNRLIASQGLVCYDGNERNLHRYALASYRAFRKNYHTLTRIETPLRALRDLLLRTPYGQFKKIDAPDIRFLGLWDTVAAYGLPIKEMTRFYSLWIWPFEMLDGELLNYVRRACHALSIDEARTTFHPLLWSEQLERPAAPVSNGSSYIKQERISQVWFAGTHSNVGGGYPDDSLAYVSLNWMMQEAKQAGLQFKELEGVMQQAHSASDSCGRLYDSRRGLGALYRYGPRDMKNLSHQNSWNNEENIQIDVPKIHHTVIERILNRPFPYAPIGLPDKYFIVDDQGRIIEPDKSPYETSEQAEFRYGHQRSIWDTVWKQQICYFGMIALLTYLFCFPLLQYLPHPTDPIRPLQPVSYTIRFVGALLPSFASPWIEAYAEHPASLLVALAAFILLWMLNSSYATAVAENMRTLWWESFEQKLKKPPAPSFICQLRANRLYQVSLTLIADIACIVLVIYLAMLVNKYTFDILDDSGLICRRSEVALPKLNVGETLTLPDEFNTWQICQGMRVWLERDGVYVVRLQNTTSFYDGHTPAESGFDSMSPKSAWAKLFMVSVAPLRREWSRPWFTVVGKIGEGGGNDVFFDPDRMTPGRLAERITARKDGELFLFVNDAVLALPGLYSFFYRDNRGSTKVSITRQR